MMLKLILQTIDGQQIEVTVGPEDTFADLQRQYERPENPGLSELLKHLITDGSEVDNNTKVFEYVTNSSSTEWLLEESLEDIGSLEQVETLPTIITDTPLQDCCAKGCTNSELTTPDKVFFPLPNDNDRLSSWLIGVGRPELVESVAQLSLDDRKKYSVCSDHFSPQQFLKGTNQLLKRRAYPLLTSFNVREETIPSRNPAATIVVEPQDSERFLTCWVDQNTNSDHPEDSLIGELIEPLEEVEADDKTHPGVLCRLCGEDAVNPVYLYTNCDNDSNLADKINLCLPITVNMMDPLPKQLCTNCHEKLNVCHKLAVECLKAEDKLKAMYESKQLHVRNAEEKHCPLCICGNMRVIPKSGIYRREKVTMNENLSNSSARTRQVSTLKNAKTEPLSSVEKDSRQDLEDVTYTSSVLGSWSDDGFTRTPPLEILAEKVSCSVCSYKGSDVYDLIGHAAEHDGYPCTICKELTFKTKTEQEMHFAKHGVQGVKDGDNDSNHVKLDVWEFECERCGEKLPRVEAAWEHLCPASEQEEEWFECHRCGKNFSKKVHLHAHMKSHDRRESILYKCSICNKQFPRKTGLYKHISKIHGGTEVITSPKCYKCKKCDEAFSLLADAESHVTDKHLTQFMMGDMIFISDHLATEELNLTKVYICEYCERCYTIPTSLHQHRQTEHAENENYQCNICNNTFEKYKILLQHKALHRKANDFEELGIKQYYLCKYCNKTFLHYGTLSVHVNQHRQPLPYSCRLCNQQFSSYKEVADHREKTHPYQSGLHEKATNSYDCTYCEKNFNHEVALVKHIRMHTGEKPYKCTICGKGFSQTSGLYTHLKVHSSLRPYTCSECPRTFKIKGDRDNHVKKHSGERPYKCNICEKAFMTQHVYSQHKRIHTNERPYKCDICGEAFRRSHVLTVHLRRHTGEKPHACHVCTKSYRQRGDLLKHIKNQHGIRSPDAPNNSSRTVDIAQNMTSDDSASAILVPI